ncbi:Uncharacterised protein [Mycobacteroides abscessus subsp. abscessus]|jgi:hypothetical protein|nr:Uncharacterised protein [Mycobacteroides abscessus subsp. abscessus]
MNEDIYEYYDVLTDAEVGELFREFTTRYNCNGIYGDDILLFLDMLDEKGLTIEKIDNLQRRHP